MFEHRDSHHTALPPPSIRARGERHRPHAERVPRGTSVVATVVLAAIVIVLALALVATMPSALVAPTAFLFIAGLIAGSLVLRTRAANVRRAVAPRGARQTRRTRRDRSMMAGAPS